MVTPAPDVIAQLAAQFDTRIGAVTDVFPRVNNNEWPGEVAYGDLVADTIRARYGTQLVLVHGSTLRSPTAAQLV